LAERIGKNFILCEPVKGRGPFIDRLQRPWRKFSGDGGAKRYTKAKVAADRFRNVKYRIRIERDREFFRPGAIPEKGGKGRKKRPDAK